ncbi:MAG: NUDIX hydrolase [Bacilli bacterium]|nr:NUDIX hydrolase [Bacilli bacterium]MDD4607516.1 NUDIX hydrolase [Bacilli bacterium]
MTRHFCASVFVVDPITKKILLVKHPKFNKWVQPGGHIEDDETPEETALREAYEETGVRVRLLGESFPRESDFIKPLGIQKNRNAAGDIHIDIIYAGVPITQDEIEFGPEESQEIGWFSRNDLENINVFPDIKITMEHILNNYIK